MTTSDDRGDEHPAENTVHDPAFKFSTPDGTEPHLDLSAITLQARKSRLGLVVLQFPAPYQDLEITYGECLGAKKWQRVQDAVAALTGTPGEK